ncbi:hypothetical protein GCM10027402_17870 [Arthrobacter monumenti]
MTAGDDVETLGMEWCSATQKRVNPRRSASSANRIIEARESDAVYPVPVIALSTMDSGAGAEPKRVPGVMGLPVFLLGDS